MIQAFKKIFIFLAILFLVGYVGNLLLDNPYMHGAIRRTINTQLDEYTHLNMSFEAVGAKFMPPGIEVYGIEVNDKDDKELLRASHVKASISFRALLFSRKEIFDIEITEPRIKFPLPPIEELLRADKFPDLNKPGKPIIWPPKKSLPFYRLAINNGQVSWQLEDQGKELISLSSTGLDAELIFRSWTNYYFQTQSTKTNLSVDGAPILLDTNIDLRMKNTRDGMKSDVFRLDSQELNSLGALNLTYELSPPRATGRIIKALNFHLDHRVRNANFALLGRYLGTEKTDGVVQGKVNLQLQIPLDDRPVAWELDGEAKAKDARIAGFKLHDSSAEFNIREEGMTFERVNLMRGKQELLQGDGFLSFQKDSKVKFEIQPLGLSMKELMDVLQVEDFTAFEANLAKTKLNLSGTISPFQLSLSGPVIFDDLTFPFVKGLGPKFPEAPRCELDAFMRITAKVFTIESGSGNCQLTSNLKSSVSPLSVTGSISYEEKQGLSIAVESKALDSQLLKHFTKLDLQGLIATRLRIAGPYDNISLNGPIDTEEINVSGFEAQSLSANLSLPFNKNLAEVKDLSFKIGGGGVKVPLFTIGFADHLPFSMKIDAQRISSIAIGKGFKKLLGKTDLKFGIDKFKGGLEGSLLEPFRYEGDADVEISDLSVDDQLIFNEVKTHFAGDEAGQKLENGTIRLDRLAARLNMESLHGKASGNTPVPEFLRGLGLDEKTKVKIDLHTTQGVEDEFRSNTVDERDNQLAAFPYVGTFFKEQKIGGRIVLDTDLEGPVGRLQGKIDGAFLRPVLFGLPVPAISFSGFLDGTKLQLPEFRHAGNSLVGRLNIDFGQPDLPYDWYVYLKQFDARAVAGKFFADDARNYAYLTAEWTMEGHLGRFWKSRGELVFLDLKSKLHRNLGSRTTALELNSSQAVKIVISPERWSFENNKPLKFHGDFFDVQISTGENRFPDNLDIRLQGSIKLDILKSFTGQVETARGELMLDGYLKGSLDKPRYSMRITERKLDPFNLKEWNPLAIGVVNVGPALSSISLDVEVQEDRLVVNRFRANKGREGTIEVTGTLLFEPSGKDVSHLLINLNRIEFNRLQIPVLKSADAVVSGDLTLTGNDFPFNLSGNLKIDRFQSIGSFDLRREIVASLYETKLFNNTSGNASPPKPLLKLDIGLSADRSIIVKNKSIEALLSANLRVRGTDTQPLLLGQIIADSGTFNYRRAFKITQAVVSFDEPVSPPNPRLDISGEAIINPYKVNIQVGGYLQNPKVSLIADPPTREDGTAITNLDIVLLITTGKISETTGNRTAEKASVNELFSSFLVFAEEPIEKLFELSGQTIVREFYMDSYVPEEDTKSNSSNKSGQQRPLTRFNIPFNLFNAASAVVQVDEEANSKLLFEYPLHEGITFTGSLDRKANRRPDSENNLPNDTGFDLKFRFGFD